MEETDRSQQVSIEIEKVNKHLACSLRDKLHDESPPLSEICIFKVPGTFRRRNEGIYEPKIVSIGPFHSGKDRLAPMQKLKLWYLHSLLARLPPLPPEEILQHFIGSLRKLAEHARNCYANKLDLSDDELVEMMIVDGCFLLELFRRDAWLVPQHNDPIFNTSWMHENLYHDLVLLENQIPWVVLQRLFELTISPLEQEDAFLIKLVLKFFETMMLTTVPAEFKSGGPEIKHILDLIHGSLLSSSENTERTNRNWELFPPVTDLLQAGVKFKEGPPDDILNIKFRNGLFKIPPIKIQGNSESLFRNLIAYEQCDRQCTHKFTSYAVFLDCLINTSKDADFLFDKRILVPALSTEDVSTLFNGLSSDTLVYGFYYDEVSKELNRYRTCHWPKWRASLKRDYFNNPWSISSFIAALLILGFTFLQTFFTIFSCQKNNSC